MKLVITIDDDIYDDYLKQGATLPKYGTAINSLYEALWNGVPLPEPCDDCVSREAIKEKKVYSEERHEYVVPVAEIDWLPSVQPQSLEQIKWERETAIEQLEQLGYGLGEKVKPCEDCVSREQSLEAMDTWDKFGYTDTGCFVREPKGDYVPYVHYDDMVKCIKNLPPVKPQPKVGHLIRWYEQKENDGCIEHIPHCKCSECGKEYEPHSSQFVKYCNKCGAKMEGEECD